MKKCLLSLSVLISSLSLMGADVPEFRGKGRTGVYDETGLAKNWGDSQQPKLLWKADVGDGFLPPSVVDGKLYLCALNSKNKAEMFKVLDKDGKLLWELEYASVGKGNYKSAKVMPTIVGDFAYMISSTGVVVCIDLKAQKIAWKLNAMQKYSGKSMNWGYAENLLVVDGKVIVTVGGTKTSVVALDAKTGEELWATKSFNESASYTSPILVEHKGKNQIVTVLFGRALGINPADGDVLWTTELMRQGINTQRKKQDEKSKFWDVTGASPLYRDGKLFLTSGYNAGALMLELPDGKGEVVEIWKNPDLDNHHGGTVLLNDRIYGANWETNQQGNWMSVDWNTGKSIYNDEWLGHSKGSVVSADGLLYVYEEKKGQVALVNPNANKFDVISSFQIKDGRGSHWAHIVISDKVMYVKRGVMLLAFDIKE